MEQILLTRYRLIIDSENVKNLIKKFYILLKKMRSFKKLQNRNRTC